MAYFEKIRLSEGAEMYETSTPLTGNGSVDSGWLDISEYDFVDAILYTDQNSATNGAKLLLSADGGTTTEKTLQNTITGGLGAFAYSIPTTAFNAVKFSYTNGSTAQTAFHFRLVAQNGANPVPLAPIGATIDPTLSGLLTRSILAAQNPSGAMSNLVTSAAGYLQNSIAEVQVDVPVKALTTLNINQMNVTTTAAQISSAATNRKTISVKALIANTTEIYVGTSNAVSTGNGYELAAGDAVEFDLTEGQALWVITATSTQRISFAEVS